VNFLKKLKLNVQPTEWCVTDFSHTPETHLKPPLARNRNTATDIITNKRSVKY